MERSHFHARFLRHKATEGYALVNANSAQRATNRIEPQEKSGTQHAMIYSQRTNSSILQMIEKEWMFSH